MFERNDVFLALDKVLDVIGEPSRNMTMQYIRQKFGTSIVSSSNPTVSLREIEEALEELFTIGAGMIIQMLEAELQMMNDKWQDEFKIP